VPFNSYSFLLFFAVVLLAYQVLGSWRQRKTMLLLASYVFYAAWNPPFVILLWVSTIADWIFARRIDRSSSRGLRRLFLLGSLGVNLGLLGYFKYGGFFWENAQLLGQKLGWTVTGVVPDIILPVGISFYTFQTLSYTLDVYRGKLKPWHSFLDYALYVTFFPQLVAGPIVRAADFLPQCVNEPTAAEKQRGWGFALIVLGLFEKVALADGLLAPVAEAVYEAEGPVDAASAWVGTLAFSGQIFCDFAGYSLCAIGAALCLGFHLPDNFRFPYGAVGFSDFWRRWHISLSTWLRDYLYIPLGGNSRGIVMTLVNLMITMFLGGLWHGARWTFVVWGLLHGVYLVLERLLGGVVPLRLTRRVWVRLPLACLTFTCVTVAWVFFRADSFSQAFSLFQSMFGLGEGGAQVLSRVMTIKAVTVVGLLFVFHWSMRKSSLEQLVRAIPWPLRSLILTGLLLGIVLLSGEDRAFIYFQF
jgi:D-alanyl-lipoteichoic acid acyltransferase DltB (MBOAT superfamily)